MNYEYVEIPRFPIGDIRDPIIQEQMDDYFLKRLRAATDLVRAALEGYENTMLEMHADGFQSNDAIISEGGYEIKLTSKDGIFTVRGDA
jgi:hypothetical protein